MVCIPLETGETCRAGLGRNILSHRIHGAAIYGDIYHQYTPNVSIYTVHGSYGYTNRKHLKPKKTLAIASAIQWIEAIKKVC